MATRINYFLVEYERMTEFGGAPTVVRFRVPPDRPEVASLLAWREAELIRLAREQGGDPFGALG